MITTDDVLTQMLHDQLVQNYRLDYVLANKLCREDYNAVQAFIIEISAIYKCMNLCAVLGQRKQLEIMIDAFKDKIDAYTKEWLPQMLANCNKINTATKKTMN